MKISRREGLHSASWRQRRNTVILAAALAAALLILSVILSVVQKRAGSGTASGTGAYAVIQINGKTVHTMPLDENALFRAEDADGHYNLVEVEDGSVKVREADCENQVCVKTGRIRNMGEVIACLPHRMILYIEEESQGEKIE